MLKALKAENPAAVRRELQTRYDDYMAGRRLRLGVHLPGVHLDTMGSTAQERTAKYEDLRDRFPKKSGPLIVNLAREILFTQACWVNHLGERRGLASAIEEESMITPRASVVYLSGSGRNAVMVSVLSREKGNLIFDGPQIMARSDMVAYLGDLPESGGLIIDPDYGLGDLKGMQTPDITLTPKPE